MANKCPNCGAVLPVGGASSCSECGLLLGDRATQLGAVSDEQEKRIIQGVSGRLTENNRFLWKVSWRTFAWFFSLLGLAFGWGIWSAVEKLNGLATKRFDALDNNMSNLVVEANARIVTNIAGQFEEPRIRKIVGDVAANQAKHLLESEINPVVKRFREETNAKLEPLQSEAHAAAEEIATIRKRMETQGTIMNSVTGELANAKLVLEALAKENEKAKERLQEMEIYANSVGLLPDGRLLLGGNLTGRAWILEKGITNLATLFSAGRFKEAYGVAKDCVGRHEKTAEALKGITMSTGDVYINNDGLCQMYSLGALSARFFDENDIALNWARKAVAVKPTAQTKLILVTSLFNMHLENEAQLLIKATLDKGDKEAEEFKQLLSANGLQRKQ